MKKKIKKVKIDFSGLTMLKKYTQGTDVVGYLVVVVDVGEEWQRTNEKNSVPEKDN